MKQKQSFLICTISKHTHGPSKTLSETIRISDSQNPGHRLWCCIMDICGYSSAYRDMITLTLITHKSPNDDLLLFILDRVTCTSGSRVPYWPTFCLHTHSMRRQQTNSYAQCSHYELQVLLIILDTYFSTHTHLTNRPHMVF